MNVVEALYSFWNGDDRKTKNQSRAIIYGDWINNHGSVGFPDKVQRDLQTADVRHYLTGKEKETLKLYVKERIFMEDGGHSEYCFIQVVVILEWNGCYLRFLKNGLPGSLVQTEEDIPDACVMVAEFGKTDEVYEGTMYMSVSQQPEDCEVVEVGKSFDLMMAEVKEGFKNIASMVHGALEAKENILIALAGKCGIGKSTLLPKQILTICHDATVIVVESRRQVCLRNVA